MYKPNGEEQRSVFPMVKLGDIIQTITPPKKFQKNEYKESGLYPILDQSQVYIVGYTD